MAESFLNAFYTNNYKAYSAGIQPPQTHLYAVQIMIKVGIGISKNRSKTIEEFRGQTFDYVFTVCNKAKRNLFVFPEKNSSS